MRNGTLKVVYNCFIRPFIRLELVNQLKLPNDSGALVTVNHIHALDPILISYALHPKYWVHYLAKEEIFRQFFFLRPLFNWVGVIPLNRTRPGIGSIKRIRKHFKQRELVGIFPQGTRRKNGFGQIKKGAARLALINQVPLYPIAITGLENVRFWGLLKRPTVKIIFGEPIVVKGRGTTKEEIIRLNQELQEKMEMLYRQICLIK